MKKAHRATRQLSLLILLTFVGTQFCSKAQQLTVEEAITKNLFFRACHTGNVVDVKYYLENGAKRFINSKDDLRQTPLFVASIWGHQLVSQILMEYGANVNIQNPRGTTPLMVAIVRRDHWMIEKLLKNGADYCSIQDHRGNTALHYAVEHLDHFEFRNLVTKGINFLVKNDKGDTALHSAAQKGSIGISNILLWHLKSYRLTQRH